MPGSPATPYYYGTDNLGSVRRVFYGGGAPTYDYDPYGNALQSTTPTTDFGYAGTYNHQPSGLNLTLYRAYDPVSSRWLSRDPIGEAGGINLYAYVGGNPVSITDPRGDFWPLAIAVAGALLYSETANAPGPCDITIPGDPLAVFKGAAVGAVLAVEEVGLATTTVGRYMSQAELDAMTASGRVQESFNNSVTSVTVLPNPGLYRAAPTSDIFTQFDVPEFSQAGRMFNMPGGGAEMQFPYAIPPDFISVVK